jgi:hypothetical protein
MYLRRRQPDGTFVTSCLYCHAVLGSAAERSDLALLEALHVCLEKNFLKTFREKSE